MDFASRVPKKERKEEEEEEEVTLAPV